jgi:hypothetical protein
VSPFLDIGYRLVALGASFYFGRRTLRSLAERKITAINDDWLDWWTPSQVFPRDAAPVRYWMFFGFEAVRTVLCFAGAIIGHWQPNG